MSEYGVREQDGFTDQLNIETPEQVALRFPVAGIGSRFLALITDSLFQFTAIMALLLLFVLVASAATWSGGSATAAAGKLSDTGAKWFTAAIILFFFLLYWGYFSLFEAFWNGQTPGKRLLKIRVIKESGRQVTFFEALARNLLRVVDSQPFYLIGVVCILCNKRQQRLGDFVAGTIVVHERTEEQSLIGHNSRTFTVGLYPQPQFEEVTQQRPSGNVLLASDAVARLDTQDLNVIDTFLARALDLERSTREEMATKIATRLAAKMQVGLPEGASAERFLEALAWELRSGARG